MSDYYLSKFRFKPNKNIHMEIKNIEKLLTMLFCATEYENFLCKDMSILIAKNFLLEKRRTSLVNTSMTNIFDVIYDKSLTKFVSNFVQNEWEKCNYNFKHKDINY